MTNQQNLPLAREAPMPFVLQSGWSDPSHPDVGSDNVPAERREPVLAMDQIQGNVIAGFSKDFQTLLFLAIDENDVAHFKAWLAAQCPFVATAGEVLAFNRLFKQLRSRRGVETGAVKATWMNIAFSFGGLVKLVGQAEAGKFDDGAFKAGAAARSHDLGDPAPGDNLPGSLDTWLIGPRQRGRRDHYRRER